MLVFMFKLEHWGCLNVRIWIDNVQTSKFNYSHLNVHTNTFERKEWITCKWQMLHSTILCMNVHTWHCIRMCASHMFECKLNDQT